MYTKESSVPGKRCSYKCLGCRACYCKTDQSLYHAKKDRKGGRGKKEEVGEREGRERPARVYNSAFPNAKTYSTMELFPKSLKTVSQETHFPNIEMKARHEMSIRKRDRTK